MDAKDWKHEYTVKHGRITDPGRFEGEPEFVPYFWEHVMNGFGHTVVDYGPDEPDDADSSWYDAAEGTYYSVLEVDEAEVVRWSELKDQSHVILWEDSQGFVYHMFPDELTSDGKKLFADYL